MRTPGGQFLRYLHTRVPWVVAIAAVVAAASTGTFWATTRIRSLDTDLSTAGQASRELRRQIRDLKGVNDDLRGRLVDIQSSLGQVSDSMRELRKRNRDLRNCVSKANPGGGPVVTLIPSHAPVGTRVEMVGHCFTRPRWQRRYPASGYGVSILRAVKVDGSKCELIAGGRKQIDIKKDGRMRGYFVVPDDGDCFQSNKTATVTPGPYDLIIGCHACTVAEFRVTTEAAERNRLADCGPGDFRWFLAGPNRAGGLIVAGVRVEPANGVQCHFTESLTLMLVNAAGSSLGVRGNPAGVTFDAALGRERVSASWAWANWCSGAQYRVQATLGGNTKTGPLQNGFPRCDFKRRPSTLRPLAPWMN